MDTPADIIGQGDWLSFGARRRTHKQRVLRCQQLHQVNEDIVSGCRFSLNALPKVTTVSPTTTVTASTTATATTANINITTTTVAPSYSIITFAINISDDRNVSIKRFRRYISCTLQGYAGESGFALADIIQASADIMTIDVTVDATAEATARNRIATANLTCEEFPESYNTVPSRPVWVETTNTSVPPCFGGDERVRMADGSTKAMRNVATGDQVLCIADEAIQPCTITTFLNVQVNQLPTTFTELHHATGSLVASFDHILFKAASDVNECNAVVNDQVDGDYIRTDQFVVGDRLVLVDALNNCTTTVAITKIGSSTVADWYAPLTSIGTLVVEDVLVSSYAASIPTLTFDLMHQLQVPTRAAIDTRVPVGTKGKDFPTGLNPYIRSLGFYQHLDFLAEPANVNSLTAAIVAKDDLPLTLDGYAAAVRQILAQLDV
eukprot:TRINITY_DN5927_c0_g1_i1.p1 TRINITY_DN5927_c0_g1~~TRINITY_DN5927_c0_g1_i1.p1  ORF type:complete len:445 (+),score=114.85 TRINITY_DN5927_c0_g1_i1:27-1337(+)